MGIQKQKDGELAFITWRFSGDAANGHGRYRDPRQGIFWSAESFDRLKSFLMK
jgi:hypothetical protein